MITLKVIFKSAAGLDIHKALIVATVRKIDEQGLEKKITKEFQTFKKGLLVLRDWLLSEQVEVVVMESTSVFWRSAFEILEDSIYVMLVNARHVRNVPGRKTDVQDSEWLATLANYGLLRPSFIPPKDIREIRLLTRYYKKLTNIRSSEKNRLQKILEDCGIRLSCVVSDIDGVSAREMIEVLIKNQSTPDELAKLAKGRLKKRMTDISNSLEANISDRHRFLMNQIQDHIKEIDQQVEKLECQVVAAMQFYRESWQLLQTIPGVNKLSAAMLLAEIGVNMASFGSSDKLCCWAGLSPGNNESAGKHKSGRTRKANPYVKSLLCELVNSAIKTKSQFKGRYETLKIRRGHKRAIIALAHRMLEICFVILRDIAPYRDPGTNYEELVVKRNAPRWLESLEKFGYLEKLKVVSAQSKV